MSLTVHVQPGGEKTVPADSFNVEAETVPDHRIRQTNVKLRALQILLTLQTKSGPSHMTCDTAAFICDRVVARFARARLARSQVRW